MYFYLLLMRWFLVFVVVIWKDEKKDLATLREIMVLHVMSPTQTDLPRLWVTRRSEVKEVLGS